MKRSFGNKAIRHISMAIRHMWRVANGFDNAGLSFSNSFFSIKWRRPCLFSFHPQPILQNSGSQPFSTSVKAEKTQVPLIELLESIL
jgi:hypothetical protein